MANFICSKCNNELDIEFKSNKGNYCKPCYNEYQKERRLKKKQVLQDVPKPVNVELNNSDEEKIKSKKPNNTSRKSDNKKMIDYASATIQTLSNLAALKFGSHWQIQEDEANYISEPLINVLSKYDFFKKASKNSDSIALIMACGSVFIPRALISYELLKIKKEEAKENDNIPEKREINKFGGESNTGDNGKNANIFETITKNDISQGAFI